mmetsp:Transcript_39952/g.67001  ORF Transcript_39952/g.67001 Transcript_39952/m.67001 type:complete len:211 (+) Transcript_39952:166-798(+)|eukprot:CAMPEP_0198200860 /NCGR_PEP_ID=MMETSP1445-20131203/3768_1 /TAXON_ID=36898 /ORGANISM="Pyramimonas sp., Strain CCMP2087" /LENGTH=210 /DNA_ID=CAMNT_0043871021 /DNA_START=151 /DNA_END=783 /DNA_ORIENTATION=+
MDDPKGSVMELLNASLKSIRNEQGEIQTGPFLDTCRLTVKIIEKLGTAFYPAKADVSGNIERLSKRASEDPEGYELIFSIVTKEVEKGEHTGSSSATKGLLWLKRFLEFVVALLRHLDDPSASLYDAASKAYKECLQPFHGFLASTAFTVILNLCGSRGSFEEAVGPQKVDGGSQFDASPRKTFVTDFTPHLQSIHTFLVSNCLDDPAKV